MGTRAEHHPTTKPLQHRDLGLLALPLDCLVHTDLAGALDVASPILQMEKLRPRQAELFPQVSMALHWNHRDLYLGRLALVPVLPPPYWASSQKRAQDTSFPGAFSHMQGQPAQGILRGGVSESESSETRLPGGPVTHLPLALSQLLHLTLLGLQDLLHLGAEGQVPRVALGSREVSDPAMQSLRHNQARPALPTLRLHLGLGAGSQEKGPSARLPWLGSGLWPQGN